MTTKTMLKCALGCGRMNEEIGKCGSFLTCGDGVSTEVVPGRDVILTVDDTQVSRVVDPLAILAGTSKHQPINGLNEFAKVTAYVIPKEAPVEAPVFTPSPDLAKRLKTTKASGKATPADQASDPGGEDRTA